MTIERLEQIEADLENDKIMRSPVLHIIAAEVRFVLMEYHPDGNKQLKAKMMTRLEAWKRNKSLARTGFAWALCGR